MPDSLSMIAELGIGIAGFSGVVTALGHHGLGLALVDRIRVIGLLMYSLGAALLATLPQLINEAGVASQTAWQVSSAVFAAYLGAIVVYAIRMSRTLPVEARSDLHPAMWALSAGGAPLFTVVLAVNASGWVREPSAGPYLAGLYYLLVFAALQFTRLLLVRPGPPPASDTQDIDS